MPFIAALGYNVFDPTEVIPEFTADVGVRRGEKVDYAIMSDNQPIILFECKAAGVNLNEEHATQLFRYFNATTAKFGVLTNGVVYRFHADLDRPNTMDLNPFLEVDLTKMDASSLSELERFAKGTFDVDSTLEAASELKYTGEIKSILSQQLKDPEDGFVRFLTGKIYSGLKTQQVMKRFTQVTREAFNQFINDRVYDRLKAAMTQGGQMIDEHATPGETDETKEPPSLAVLTTVDEMEGFYIVKAILSERISPGRINMRDVQSYCGILLDGNNRKPICRLHFNSAQKYVGLFNSRREEERIPIENVDDIYSYADRLRDTVGLYESADA